MLIIGWEPLVPGIKLKLSGHVKRDVEIGKVQNMHNTKTTKTTTTAIATTSSSTTTTGATTTATTTTSVTETNGIIVKLSGDL